MVKKPDFVALFEASPYPYLLIDTDFILIGANPAYLRATGRTADDIVGKHIFAAFPGNPSDPESTNLNEVRVSIELAIATRMPHTSALLRYAVPRETPHGRVFDERYWSAIHTPVFDAGGAVAFVAQNAIDVTDLYRFDAATRRYYLKQGANAVPDVPERGLPHMNRPQMHEAMTRILNAERSQLQILFDQAPGFMAVLGGLDHRIDMVNDAYYQLVGYRDVLGKPMFEALPELAGQGFEQLLDSAFESGKPVVQRERRMLVRRTPGAGLEERYVDLVYQPILGQDGRVTGIFAQGSDITDRHLAQEQLKTADRRKDEFLAMLAHELRNPLAPIGAAAQLLQRGTLDEARVRRTSEVIGRQVKHMTHLIDDLLDVSRVTGGLVTLDQAPQDIRDVVAEAVEQVTPLIRARGHSLALHLSPDSTLVDGDKKRLVQVVANILNNAAKYTGEGGHIALHTAVDGGHVVLRVDDDGIGMAPELVAHAFDLFAQAERSPDRSAGGLGLGLALVKTLVELHGGTVSCRSAGAGKGSTFTVCLPRLATPARRPDVREGAGTTAPGGRPLRIMIVDDNADAAAMLAMLLETAGHQVTVEHDARDALARAPAARPEVFLLDIGLPGMDGSELARRLRQLPAAAGAVLVAVTGYGQDGDRARTREAGFDHHLVKPLDVAALFAVLDAL